MISHTHTPEILGDVYWNDSRCAAAGRCDPLEETGREPTRTHIYKPVTHCIYFHYNINLILILHAYKYSRTVRVLRVHALPF